MTMAVLLVLGQGGVWDAGVFSAADPWKVEQRGRVTVSSRPVPSTPYFEYRAELDGPGTAAQWCEEVFEWGSTGTDHPGLTRHELLRGGADERVVYHRIEQPIVKNRDFTFTVARRAQPDGSCRIRFLATNELGPPPAPAVVRMDRLWGSWTFQPLGDGGTHATYTMFADPGGTIPPFLVHGSQKSAARDTLLEAERKMGARLR